MPRSKEQSGAADDPIRLNEAQQAFVDYRGPAILHAPVGTGKTLALAERAAAAIRAGTTPSRILCLTFTNRAASEMRDRISLRCAEDAQEVAVQTFHSFATWFLRAEAKGPGLPADFIIFDDEDSVALLEAVLHRWANVGESKRYGGLPVKARDLYNLLQKEKAAAASEEARPRLTPGSAFLNRLKEPWRSWAAAYQQDLWNAHALDFGDLILYTRWLLEVEPEIRHRWERAFDLIQVDEMQDTHLSEYRIVRVLARLHRNIALAGDFDQTIYEWRGSTPEQVLKLFQEDFSGVRSFSFTENHRSTRRLLEVAAAVAATYSRRPPPVPSAGAEEGEPVRIHVARDGDAEGQWIGQQILKLAAEAGKPQPLARIGVLTRTNGRSTVISRALDRLQVPHLTVDTYEFFRRQEVKDALAYLRFLLNPYDEQSFRRILLRPARGIGERTLQAIHAARESGLRLADLVAPTTLETGDPFGRLLDQWTHGWVTVFDTETTGVRIGRDEVVELAAVRLEQGRAADRFHRYLRNTVPVAGSTRVHGLDDAFLHQQGEDPAAVFLSFQQFARGSLLVGHNVGFDVQMVASHARRVGLDFDLVEYGDTFETARRFLPGYRLSLGALVERLGLDAQATHRAMDDVEATCALLEHIMPLVAEGRAARRAVVERVREPFRPLAADLRRWRRGVGRLRPAELLEKVLEESGLAAYYQREDKQTAPGRRMAHLRELVQTFARRDKPGVDPLSALEQTLTFAALARNVDRLDSDDNRVRILTVHQSKGLEFDSVFVAGLSENEFPHFYSLREGRELEERRLFYVAVTRARKHLFLTAHREHDGKQRAPSGLLGLARGRGRG